MYYFIYSILNHRLVDTEEVFGLGLASQVIGLALVLRE